MAQGFITSEGMLSGCGRELAQSAILVISNGDYPSKSQTAEKARELEDNTCHRHPSSKAKSMKSRSSWQASRGRQITR